MARQPLVARRAEELLGAAVVATAPVAGGDIATATRLRLSNGTTALMKTLPHAPPGFFEAEAAGLRWLAEVEGGVPVPPVLAVDAECLILTWVEPSAKQGLESALAFGQALATTHAAGAASYGAERTASSAACRCPTAPARRGRSSTPCAGCCPTSSSPATATRSRPRTRARSSPSSAACATSSPRSRRRGCTATCGTATACGAPTRSTSSTRRRTPGTARSTSRCSTSSACRTSQRVVQAYDEAPPPRGGLEGPAAGAPALPAARPRLHVRRRVRRPAAAAAARYA